ncbi:hypothetical protein Tco_0741638 [Tanacetum coccineum]
MSSMGELTFFLGLQVKQQPDGIFISQDKYVAGILKKFDFCSIKTTTTPIEPNKPLVKDEDDVDVHVYMSMIGSLMYLTSSRPNIMFFVCACARFQVTPKASHLNAVKRIFRYLKHQPKLGLWYPRDSPFELEAFSDSDYGGASLDRKSTTEYVAAANCYGQRMRVTLQKDHLTPYPYPSSHQVKHLRYSLTYLPDLSPTTHIPDSILEGSGGNHGAQAKEIKALKAQVKKLKKGVKPLITHHKAWMKTRLARKTSLKKKGVHKEYVSKQGRKSIKSFKGEPSVHKDPAFDDLDDFVDVDDTLDYMVSEDAQNEGRISYVVLEEKGNADKEVSIEAPVSTIKPNEGTDKKNEGSDKQDGGTDSTKVVRWHGEGTANQNEGKSVTQTAPTSTSTSTPTTPTPTVFGDDETIAQVFIIMSQNKEKIKEKEKGVEIRNNKDTERPRPTSTRSILTLRPLPKIDPKDKGKKRIEEEDESDTESEGINEAEKKFKQLANDKEGARKVQEEWEAEEEKKRLDEEEATKAALSNEYDFIQARLNAEKILVEKLQEEEREMYTIKQRTKFLHDTIAAQRRFLAQQRSEAIRNKPPSRNKLRKQLMSDDSFIAIGSAEDEKMIKEMNEQAVDASKKRVKKDDSVMGEIKEEEGTRKRKLGKRKKMKSKKRKFTSKDDEELRLCLTIAPDEDKDVYDETKEVEDIYLNVVIRSNRQRRYFSTLMAVLSVLDRDNICAIYQLVMKQITKDETHEVRNKHENDRDDEEDCYVKIDEMGKPIYGLNIEKYLNCDDPMDRALALQETLNPFRKKGDGDGKWHAKVRIMEPYGNVFDQGYKTKSTDRKLLKYYKLSDIMSPNRLGGHGHKLTILELVCRLGLCTSDEIHDEGFDTYFLGGLRDDDHFNVNQYWSEISSENELILSRSSTRTIRKLVLRVLQKMITYGLCQRTTGYDKVQRNELWLMSMFEAKHQNGYVNVAWLIVKWLKMKGVGSQREGMICCGQFIIKIARRANLLTDEVLNGLSAPVYCRSLDTTTLRKLIDSNGRLVAEDGSHGDSSREIRADETRLARDYAPPGYDEERDEK